MPYLVDVARVQLPRDPSGTTGASIERPRKRRREEVIATLVDARRPHGPQAPLQTFGRELDALFVDPVTYASLRDPYVLAACGHSFDVETLEALSHSCAGNLACPLCRTPVQGPCPPNYLARSMLELAQRHGLHTGDTPVVLRRGRLDVGRVAPSAPSAHFDDAFYFCCLGATLTLTTLGLGISSREEDVVRNACALTAWAVGIGFLLAGYTCAVWPKAWQHPPRPQV